MTEQKAFREEVRATGDCFKTRKGTPAIKLEILSGVLKGNIATYFLPDDQEEANTGLELLGCSLEEVAGRLEMELQGKTASAKIVQRGQWLNAYYIEAVKGTAPKFRSLDKEVKKVFKKLRPDNDPPV